MFDFFSSIGDFLLNSLKSIENFISGYAQDINDFFSEYFVFFSDKINGVTSFSYLDAVFSLPILTLGFIFLILGVWFFFFFIKFNEDNVESSQTILTSLGIFGTFLGIAIGLSGFDPTDISGSVPLLINGLKTSFWSSVVGLLTALTIKIRHLTRVHIAEHKAEKAENSESETAETSLEEEEKTVEDVVSEIKNLSGIIGKTEDGKSSLMNSVNKLNTNLLQQMGVQNNLLTEIKLKLSSSPANLIKNDKANNDKDHQISSSIATLTQSVNQLVKSQTTTNEQMQNLMDSFSESNKNYENLASNFDRKTNTLVNDIEVLNSQLKSFTGTQQIIGESQLG